MTKAGENFLFHDSGFEENRIIIFATAKNLETMRDFQDWQIDGMFKVCPQVAEMKFTLLVWGEPAKRKKKSQQTAEKLLNLLQRYDRNKK